MSFKNLLVEDRKYRGKMLQIPERMLTVSDVLALNYPETAESKVVDMLQQPIEKLITGAEVKSFMNLPAWKKDATLPIIPDIYEVQVLLEENFSLNNPNHLKIIRELFSFQNIYHNSVLYDEKHLIEVRENTWLITYFSKVYPANRTGKSVSILDGVLLYRIEKIAYGS